MTKPPHLHLRLQHYPVPLRSSHFRQYLRRQFHKTTSQLGAHSQRPPQPPPPQPQPPHQPQKPAHSHLHAQASRPPRRQIGRFSLPVFLFFAFTFAAITTSMDTRPTPHKNTSTSISSHPATHQLDSSDLDDASPTSPFVDDNGNPLLPSDSSADYDDVDGIGEGSKGIRDIEKERQHDTFNRYGRQRRVPWTLKEVAEAERWQRESRGVALEDERRRS